MTTWENIAKTGEQGQGWLAGDSDITAGMTIEPVSGNRVFAGFIGQSATWSNQSPKNTTNYSTPSKTSSTWTKINKS